MGALYISDRVKIRPIVFGGEQQKNIRSGTENVPGIAGFALAAKMAYTNLEEKTMRMRNLKERFIQGVTKMEHVSVHGLADETSAPHIVSVGIAGAEVKCFFIRWKKRNLCIFRIRMFLESSWNQRRIKRNRSGTGISGCDTSVQSFGIYNRRRN